MIESVKEIYILGTGNVAWHYEKRLKEKGYACCMMSARGELSCCFKADLVIIAVKDEAVEEVAKRLKGMKGILVHTSGFLSTDCLSDVANSYGSFYPLQSLTKNKEIDFDKITLCTYGNTPAVRQLLQNLAKQLSCVTCELSDEQRKSLHLAAVFCNNFTNHLFGIAKSILDKEDIPFSILHPLMDMTIEKAKNFEPFEVQTGPAIRKDYNIMQQHKDRLAKDEKDIYELLSEKIISYHNNKE